MDLDKQIREKTKTNLNKTLSSQFSSKIEEKGTQLSFQ